MTILVIILTVVNLVPTFFNWGVNDYSNQLSNIETQLAEINTSDDLSQIESKIDEVGGLILGDTSDDRDKIIELLESIQNELKYLMGSK